MQNELRDIEVNQLFFDLQEVDTRFVICYGGAGSGKSYTLSQFLIASCLHQKEKILVLRKVAVTLKDSCVSLFETILKDWGVWDRCNYNKSTMTLTFPNGSIVLFKGLEDPERIKSIAGITKVWFEEMSEFEEADFNQINLRMRGKKNLQLFGAFNPIDETHWLKGRFFDYDDEDATIFHSTFEDNDFLDDAYLKELEKYKKLDYNYYRVYALGQWGKLNAGGEFYKSFDYSHNVSSYSYNANLPLHISFDENVNPYFPAVVFQAEGNKAWQIDELIMKSPTNTVQHMATEIKKRYHNHKAGLFIYGDATSQKKDVKQQKGHNLFTLLKKELEQFKPQLRVQKSNPSVMMRGLFINDLFAGGIDNTVLSIDEGCKVSIEDLKYLKEAPDGTKSKEMYKDPKTGVRYQRYGHTSDAMDYFVCVYFRKEFNEFQGHGTTIKRTGKYRVNKPL